MTSTGADAAPPVAPPAADAPTRPPRLLLLVAAPTLWAVHFLASYITVAIWCAKASATASGFTPVVVLIACYSVAALAGVGVVSAVGVKRVRERASDGAGAPSGRGASAGEILGPSEPFDGDTDVDRTRFLGFATLLLCGLSAIGIVFAGIVIVFVRSCQ